MPTRFPAAIVPERLPRWPTTQEETIIGQEYETVKARMLILAVPAMFQIAVCARDCAYQGMTPGMIYGQAEGKYEV